MPIVVHLYDCDTSWSIVRISIYGSEVAYCFWSALTFTISLYIFPSHCISFTEFHIANISRVIQRFGYVLSRRNLNQLLYIKVFMWMPLWQNWLWGAWRESLNHSKASTVERRNTEPTTKPSQPLQPRLRPCDAVATPDESYTQENINLEHKPQRKMNLIQLLNI